MTINNYICTVLIITYNQENSIEKAIKSVLSQNTKYEYKIHIFDDCSTDDTPKIIKKYEKLYPDKIKLFISPKNRGSSDNFWAAYKSVDTKYCAILEGDDYWCDNDKLELQINALNEHPECASCAANTVIYNIGDLNDTTSDGELMINQSLLNKKQIFDYEFLKKKYCGYINHLSSRMINMHKVNLDEINDQETFCYDNAQFFYLLSKGPVYMLDRVVSARIMTGKGVFSSVNALKKIRMLVYVLLEANRQTDYVIEDVIYEHMQNYMGYYLYIYNFNDKAKISNNFSIIRGFEYITTFRDLKHYILPRFLLDFLDIPRDLIRLIRKNKKIKKSLEGKNG